MIKVPRRDSIRTWSVNFDGRDSRAAYSFEYIARPRGTSERSDETISPDRISRCEDTFVHLCVDNFQGLPPEAIPAFLQNLQNSAGYNIAKPIARPAAYHPYHRPSHQPPQRHLPPNAHHTLQQLFYRGPYLTGERTENGLRASRRIEGLRVARRPGMIYFIN